MDSVEPDYYATLGLDRRCTTAQVRAAYRLLAKRLHPDVAGDSTEAAAFKALNAAHAVLSDPARRRAYEQELEEIAPSRPPARAGKLERNVSQDVHLRIEDLLRGTNLDVRVDDPGNADGPETYTLEVPPGTAAGTRFRLPRSGTFEGGFVQLRAKVLPNGRFKVRGSDLRCDLRINAQRAAQGGGEMVPGPAGGLLRVTIPPGTARGETLRIPGEGLPKPRGGRGDLLVRVTYRPDVRVSRTGRS